jgi:subtilisin family serine protease
MAKCFVRFPSETDTQAAMVTLALNAPEAERPYRAARDPHLMIADFGPEQIQSARDGGAQVFEDVLFSVVGDNPLHRRRANSWEYWSSQPMAMAAGYAAPPAAPALAGPIVAPTAVLSLNDVAAQVRAPQAWAYSRGQGVTIAIVDTGIAKVMPEFPTAKRSPYSVAFAYSDPWADTVGHGSMCAAAAAATKAAGGRFNGIAPDATILAARTTLFSTDIYKIYDRLIDEFEAGNTGPLVISNSYGMYTCSAPSGLPQDHPYLGIVREAVSKGIVVSFAAGNNHADVLCNHPPTACGPNTIWGVNSIDEVLTVGTVNQQERNDSGDHANSSRGPGQWATRSKPDVVAPTYGEIVWGAGYQVMSWWGTSGACPQVAGLAALLLSANPTLTPAKVTDIIVSTAKPLTQANTCVGAGMIDCEAAVQAALP